MKLKLHLLFVAIFALTITGMAQTATNPPPDSTPSAAPLKAIEDATVRSGWRRYQFGNHPAFSVILPAAPEVSASRAPGTASVTSIYTSTSATGIYVVGRADDIPGVLEKASAAAQQKYFEDFFKGFVEGFREAVEKNSLGYQLQLLTTKKVMIAATRQGFQQEMNLGPFKGRAQLVFVGQSAFCVIGIWNENTPAAEVEAYFKSFQFTKSRI